MSINKVILLGRLGKDPELKHLNGGQAVCSFSLATTESWTDKQGQKQEKTEWSSIVVWGKLAELCEKYLKKGHQAFVEGKLQTRSWDDKDGKKQYKTEILATAVQFLGGGRSSGPGPGGAESHGDADVTAANNFAADDIPF